MTQPKLPLEGIRVVEFCHVVMGPTCGLVLADLGAEVIKVEPLDGDHTRKLVASGAGFFPTYNRNKKSFAVDLKSPQGREAVLKLIASADVVIENFRPGAMDKLGFGYEALRRLEARAHLLLAEGLPAGSLRASHRARRGGADDGRARLHDGRALRPAARRRVGQRRHGRHVRRDRDTRRASPAQQHRQGPVRAERAVREQRVSHGAAHDGRARDRQAGDRRCRTASARGRSTTTSRPATASWCSSAW